MKRERDIFTGSVEPVTLPPDIAFPSIIAFKPAASSDAFFQQVQFFLPMKIELKPFQSLNRYFIFTPFFPYNDLKVWKTSNSVMAK